MKVPMLKYDLLVHHREWNEFLQRLRALGLVHLDIREEAPVEDISAQELEERLVEAKKVLGIVRRLYKRSKGIFSEMPQAGEMPGSSEIIAAVEQEEILARQLAQLERERQQLAPWGRIDWAMLKRLRKKGVRMRFYECAPGKFNPEWEKSNALVHVGNDGQLMRFAIFFQGNDLPALGIQESTLPGKYLDELNKQVHQCRVSLSALRERNEQASAWLPAFEENVLKLESNLVFRKALATNESLVDGKVLAVSGYLPEEKAPALDSFLKNEGVVFLSQKAIDDPQAPVLLKNSRFAKLFEPIGGLYSLPGHSDIDLTPFFAPFFLLFFGFCLGDAGYGAVLLILATIFKRRSNMNQWKEVLTLAQFFGISTIVFGIISGTLFGLSLLDFDLGFSFKDYILDNNGLLALALILGFAQILFGLAIRTVRNWLERGPIYALSGIGWMILMPVLALSSQDIGPAWLGKIAYPALALIIIPSKPEAGWKSPLFGILDLYNITGFIGDLLSYIRLFALGISSAILGLVVNTIALKTLNIPLLGPVIFVLLLVVGHGGNLMLASLSAFVHPLRLTFVEFYKNAGFNGGGKPFKPFTQTLK